MPGFLWLLQMVQNYMGHLEEERQDQEYTLRITLSSIGCWLYLYHIKLCDKPDGRFTSPLRPYDLLQRPTEEYKGVLQRLSECFNHSYDYVHLDWYLLDGRLLSVQIYLERSCLL